MCYVLKKKTQPQNYPRSAIHLKVAIIAEKFYITR